MKTEGENVFLVTGCLSTGVMEVSTLHLWMRKDVDLWCKRRFKDKISGLGDWVILAAYDSSDEAQSYIDNTEPKPHTA